MKTIQVVILMTYIITFTSCGSENNKTNEVKPAGKDSTVGVVELYDKSASDIIDSSVTFEIIGRNYNWSEGPVWIADKKMLLFSDVPKTKYSGG